MRNIFLFLYKLQTVKTKHIDNFADPLLSLITYFTDAPSPLWYQGYYYTDPLINIRLHSHARNTAFIRGSLLDCLYLYFHGISAPFPGKCHQPCLWPGLALCPVEMLCIHTLTLWVFPNAKESWPPASPADVEIHLCRY